MSPIRRMTAIGLIGASLAGGLGAATFAVASTATAASMVEYTTHAPAAAPDGRAWNGIGAAAAPDGRAWNGVR
jgi:hypothetical protein